MESSGGSRASGSRSSAAPVRRRATPIPILPPRIPSPMPQPGTYEARTKSDHDRQGHRDVDQQHWMTSPYALASGVVMDPTLAPNCVQPNGSHRMGSAPQPRYNIDDSVKTWINPRLLSMVSYPLE
ncbi:uncharacterized protein LOC124158201 [Ischnura elegans]|uniref:uncharacterized protein LOC124158201 n=1 Tax=Ischnura elegans TaxID=197161 RepID=UPI001ED87B1C|nr:uncharacterized protein LOC124158201 [Ischnura elegans]